MRELFGCAEACMRFQRIHGPRDLTREDALPARTILVRILQGIFFSKTLKSLNSRLEHLIMTISLYPTRHRILFCTLIFGFTSSALPKLSEISNRSWSHILLLGQRIKKKTDFIELVGGGPRFLISSNRSSYMRKVLTLSLTQTDFAKYHPKNPTCHLKHFFQISMQPHIQIAVSGEEAIQLRPNRSLGLAVISCPFRIFVLSHLKMNQATYSQAHVSVSLL